MDVITFIDAGPIALKRYFDLDQGETGLSLMTKCVNQGVVLMLEFLDIAERSQGEVPLEAQDMSKRRYYSKKDIPVKGKSEWDQPCVQIERLIRACNYQPFVSPWAHPVIEIKKCSMGVIDAECTGIMSSDQPGSIRIDEKGDYLVCTRGDRMTLNDLYQEISKALELSGSVILTPQTNISELWDSVNQTGVLTVLKRKFNVTLTANELAALTTVQDIIEILKSKEVNVE